MLLTTIRLCIHGGTLDLSTRYLYASIDTAKNKGSIMFEIKYEIKKSIEINATPHAIIETLGDLKTWSIWSPWVILDPQTKLIYEGNPKEIGSNYRWESRHIGEGKMTIEKINETHIDYFLEFFKPWKSTAKAHFSVIKISEDITLLTWTMQSHLPLFMFWMKNRMKAWIGMDFERGLELLKCYIEQGKIEMELYFDGVVETSTIDYVGIPNHAKKSQLSKVMGEDFKKLLGDFVPTPQSTILSIITKFDMFTDDFEFICAISDPAYTEAKTPYITGTIPSSKALKVRLKGDYAFLSNAWSMVIMHQRSGKYKIQKDTMGYEVYLNNPSEVAPHELLTEIYLPIR